MGMTLLSTAETSKAAVGNAHVSATVRDTPRTQRLRETAAKRTHAGVPIPRIVRVSRSISVSGITAIRPSRSDSESVSERDRASLVTVRNRPWVHRVRILHVVVLTSFSVLIMTTYQVSFGDGCADAATPASVLLATRKRAS